MSNWDGYLWKGIPQLTGIDAHTFMLGVGVIEIAAGVLVAFAPRIFAWVVGFWLWAIILNLLLTSEYYDVALRDFGLSLAPSRSRGSLRRCARRASDGRRQCGKTFSPAPIATASRFSCGGSGQRHFSLYAQYGLYARLKSTSQRFPSSRSASA